MHTEHLSNVTLSWVLIGWIVSVAIASVLILLFSAVGLTGDDSTLWGLLAIGVGYFAGGYLTGTRDIEAPILHGVGIGLTTLVAWFLANLIGSFFLESGEYSMQSAAAAGALLLLQMVAAVAGAWIADRRALRGENLQDERLG